MGKEGWKENLFKKQIPFKELPNSGWQGSPVDYDRYRLTIWEGLLTGLLGGGIAAGIDYIFYRSIWGFFLLSPLIIQVPCWYRKHQIRKRREALGMQFKDAILSLSAALQTGYSVENAWTESWKEMVSLYGEGAWISRELSGMVKAISVNETPESLIQDLANRSKIPEIRMFAEIFTMAKRSSGDLVTIIDHTAQLIHEKLRVREEILTQTAAKQLEQSVMSVIPAGIILYLNMAFEGFLDPLYKGRAGRGVMTGCLIVYAAAIWIGRRLTQPKEW
jgi:tight adherence protein B